MGHASIAEKGTYRHLVRERHERDVDALDVAFRAALRTDDDEEPRELQGPRRPTASHLRSMVC